MKAQGQLLRFVRREDGTIEVDPRRRLPGRGAYLCRSTACLEEALKRKRFAYAFRGGVTLPAEGIAAVRRLIAIDEASGDHAR